MQSNWKWSGRSACSNWCRWGVQCPNSCGKYRRELRYHTWWSHQCAPAKNARTTPELFVIDRNNPYSSLFGLSKHHDFPHKTPAKQLIPPKICVVGFHNGCSDLWAAPNREGDLALLSVIHGQAFQHQATKARSSATTTGVVHAETLQTCII